MSTVLQLLPTVRDVAQRAAPDAPGPDLGPDLGSDLGRTPFTVGPWRIDAAARTATDGAVITRLSPKAMQLLLHLAEAGGGVRSRSELLDLVWPDVHVGDESLTQAIAELRRKLGDRAPGGARLIETVSKAGYRLVAPVHADAPDLGASRALAIAQGDDRAEGFDLDAYLLCLDAQRLIARGDADAIEMAEALTREAIERAPRFAYARAEFAIAAVYRALYRAGSSITLQAALSHAEIAAQLRPDLPTVHAAHGFALGALGELDGARHAFSRALFRDRTDAETHYLCGRALFANGDMRGAAAIAERAAALAPDDFRGLYLASRAATAFDKGLARHLGEQCLERLRKRLAADPSEPRARHTIGPVLAQLGRCEEARVAMAAMAGGNVIPVAFYRVVGAAEAGDPETALDTLEGVMEGGWRDPGWLRAEPAFAPLASHPRFRRCAELLGAA
ncbi:MAG: winged helix-turn-helix domain-containing protein [Pseudomonadota bacterium]